MNRSLVWLSLLCGCAAFAQNGWALPLLPDQSLQTKTFCRGRSVPLSVVVQRVPVSVSAGSFFSNEEYSGSTIHIVNDAREPIVRALVVVEFRDGQRGALLTIVHYFRDDTVLDADMKTNFSGEERFLALVGGRYEGDYLNPTGQPYRRAIAPGKSMPIAGITNTSATVCPSAGVVTGIAVEYRNGRMVTDFAPGWHLDPEVGRPLPVSMQGGETIAVAPTEPVGQFHATVRVNPDGCGVLVDTPPNISEWIGRTIPRIPFVPAMTDGRPTKQDVSVFFVFHNSSDRVVRRSWSQAAQLPRQAAILHLWEKDGAYVLSDLDQPHKLRNCPVESGQDKGPTHR